MRRVLGVGSGIDALNGWGGGGREGDEPAEITECDGTEGQLERGK